MLFVTGKGGVGKTTIATALALRAARLGRKVLLCDIDAKGSVAAAVESPTLKFESRQVHPGLFAMAMDTEASLKEYLRLHLHLPLVARIGPLARTFDFVATAAPGVKELLTIGKICWEVKERHFDVVIVDAPASGHVVGLLDAPKAINGLVQVGLVRNQTRWMLELLEDPATTGVVVVTTAEEMPVTETIELAQRLEQATEVDLAAVVVNRVLPELFTRDEAVAFAAIDERADELRQLAGPGVPAVLEAAHLATMLRRSRSEHLTRLRSELGDLGVGPGDLVYVPEQFTRLSGLRSTLTIADRLAEELGA